jgi:hypothetical protein
MRRETTAMAGGMLGLCAAGAVLSGQSAAKPARGVDRSGRHHDAPDDHAGLACRRCSTVACTA